MKKSEEADFDEIRRLIQKTREANGGGLLLESLSAAARKIGITPASLNTFMHGKNDADPDTLIKIARYLGMPSYQVLRLGGHRDTAAIIEAEIRMGLASGELAPKKKRDKERV